MKNLFLILATIIIGLGACKKQTKTNAPWLTSDKVFISGINDNNRATYWTKDSAVQLDDSVSRILKIIYANNKLYSVGSSKLNGKQVPCVYEGNGTITYLPCEGGHGFATDILVKGNDVYICGTLLSSSNHPGACYWHNGEFHWLEQSIYETSNAVAIAEHNGDIFIAGNLGSFDDLTIGVVWKNARHELAFYGYSPQDRISIHDIAIDKNGTVFTCGSYYYKNIDKYYPTYWNNDYKVELFPGKGYNGTANAITLVSNASGQEDVHTVGTLITDPNNVFKTTAFHNKGYEPQLLKSGMSTIGSTAHDIKILNGDAHIIGFNYNLCYWLNGEPKILTTPNTNKTLYASSIWVNP